MVQSYLLMGVFLYFIGKYGLDGLKLRLEKEYRNGTITGATIISHTIKNELSKIHCNIDAVKRGISDADKALDNIDMAAEHMYEIVDRIGRHEVLNNIVINAIEAISCGNGRILVELSSIKKQAVIRISDNGMGIPPDRLAKVTNPFYSTKDDGAGIRGSGLYYCVSVIERHHGELKINSEPDIGTTVDIKLPLWGRSNII